MLPCLAYVDVLAGSLSEGRSAGETFQPWAEVYATGPERVRRWARRVPGSCGEPGRGLTCRNVWLDDDRLGSAGCDPSSLPHGSPDQSGSKQGQSGRLGNRGLAARAAVQADAGTTGAADLVWFYSLFSIFYSRAN